MADVAPANGFGTTVMHPDAGTISLLYAEDGIDKWTTLTHWRPDAIDTRLATRTHFVVRAGQTTNGRLLLGDCSVLSFVLVACSHSGHAGGCAKTRSTMRTFFLPLPYLGSLATMEQFLSKNRRSWQRSVRHGGEVTADFQFHLYGCPQHPHPQPRSLRSHLLSAAAAVEAVAAAAPAAAPAPAAAAVAAVVAVVAT